MAYLFLLVTIVFETAAIIFMKLSFGFENKGWAACAITAYLLSFVFLTWALKIIPAGIANAIWAGASTILVAILGVVIFKEQLSGWQIVFLAMIVIGLVGLNLSKG